MKAFNAPFNHRPNPLGTSRRQYFSDGITEDIITDLSKVSQLFVIARNSAFVYKDKTFNVSDVCRELGVKFALEGSIRKAANRVRITAQLIDGMTGNHVWAERYDGDIDDIFDLQDRITEQDAPYVLHHGGFHDHGVFHRRRIEHGAIHGPLQPDAYRREDHI